MICEERTRMNHNKRGGVFNVLKLSLTEPHEVVQMTLHNSTDWLLDRELNQRIWQARSLWQSYDLIQAGHLPPK